MTNPRAPVNATIAVMVVPPPERPVRKRRASDQPTIQGEALKPSQQHTVAVPAVREDDDAIAKGLTVVPTAKTVFASDGSSCELPFDAEIVFEPAPPPRPVTVRRRITLGDGVLQRVPQQRAWLLPTIVAITTLAAALVVVVAT